MNLPKNVAELREFASDVIAVDERYQKLVDSKSTVDDNDSDECVLLLRTLKLSAPILAQFIIAMTDDSSNEAPTVYTGPTPPAFADDRERCSDCGKPLNDDDDDLCNDCLLGRALHAPTPPAFTDDADATGEQSEE